MTTTAEITGPLYFSDSVEVRGASPYAAIICCVLAYFAEIVDGATEGFGELSAEYRGEVARFGDAWPGAAIQVRDAEAAIARAEATYRALAEAAKAAGLPDPAWMVEAQAKGVCNDPF